jgi:hypothetical protein
MGKEGKKMKEFNANIEATLCNNAYSFIEMGLESLGLTELGRRYEQEYVENGMKTFVGTMDECIKHKEDLFLQAKELRRTNNKYYNEKFNEFKDLWFDIRSKEVYNLNSFEKEFAKLLYEQDFCESLENAMNLVHIFTHLLKRE